MDKEKILPIVFIGIVVLALIIGYIINGRVDKEYNFKIHFFNAGKADAIVLEKDGKYMMIDTGEEDLQDKIINYFRQNNITRLEYLIITHFDKDHVGSASAIIDNIEIGEVLQSNVPKESSYYTNYLNSLETKGITPTTVSGDYEISFADLTTIVNGPTTIYDNNESNNSSLIVKITDQDNTFLFMGDSENSRIKDFLTNNTETYTFLKVPYHGHYQKRLESLLEEGSFKYAVITSSLEELEDEETIELLTKYNIDYYLTREGSITILSNGKDLIIKQ